MSLFVTFEGGEGSGKSLQAGRLYRRLLKLAVPALLTHEPGGTHFGRRLGRWLKWQGRDVPPLVELMLFNASRAQLVSEVIGPALDAGRVVISDRFADSTIVYQGYGRGLELATVTAINNAAIQGRSPNLTILMDIPVEVGLGRKAAQKPDRFEQEGLDFHRRVRQGYLELAAAEPERFLVVDATGPKEEIARAIWQRVRRMITARGA